MKENLNKILRKSELKPEPVFILCDNGDHIWSMG